MSLIFNLRLPLSHLYFVCSCQWKIPLNENVNALNICDEELNKTVITETTCERYD
jgi:hypothetical protein